MSRLPHLIRNPAFFIPLLLVMALAISLFWFFSNFERKSYELSKGISPAARQNRFLAAERYLQALGIPTEARNDGIFLKTLPPPTDAIFLPYMPGGVSETTRDGIYRWIEAGGHLILAPHPFRRKPTDRHYFLDRFGVRLIGEEERKETETGEDTCSCEDDEDADTGYHPYKCLRNITVGTYPITLRIRNCSSSASLLVDTTDSATYRISGDYRKTYSRNQDTNRSDNNRTFSRDGAWLLEYTVGKGRVTVLSEKSFADNWNIDQYNHAFFLSWLVRDAAKVWICQVIDQDSLFTIAWNAAPFFWVSLAIILLLILWKMQRRSGLVIPRIDDEKQSVLTHIEATGNYHWRMDRAAGIISANRQTLLQLIRRKKMGGTANAPQDLTTDLLAQKTGLQERLLAEALQQRTDEEQSIIRTSRAQQDLLTALQGKPTEVQGDIHGRK